MLDLARRWLPQPAVLHPFPDARFAATHPQIDVASFADAEQLLLAPGGVLPWHEAEPCREVASPAKGSPVTDGGHCCGSFLSPTSSFIRVLCKVLHKREECRRLADEQAHGSQEIDHSHGDSFSLSRPNYGTPRQIGADKRARLGHDEI